MGKSRKKAKFNPVASKPAPSMPVSPNPFGVHVSGATLSTPRTPENTMPAPLAKPSREAVFRESAGSAGRMTPIEQAIGRTEDYPMRPSTARPDPVDAEGIRFFSTGEIAGFLNAHKDTIKRKTYMTEIPHYVELKGAKGKHNTHFSLSEVIKYANNKGLTEVADHMANVYNAHKNAAQLQAKATGTKVPTLHDNPDLALHMHHFPVGRTITAPENVSDDPSSPNIINTDMGTTSNVREAIKSGAGRNVAEELGIKPSVNVTPRPRGKWTGLGNA